jgi:hypothetical protein
MVSPGKPGTPTAREHNMSRFDPTNKTVSTLSTNSCGDVQISTYHYPEATNIFISTYWGPLSHIVTRIYSTMDEAIEAL